MEKGITNRGWREGWDVYDTSKLYTSSVYRGRYDSLETTMGLKWKAFEEDFYLHLYPEVGFAVIGDCSSESVQNRFHSMTGIHVVELPEEMEGERRWLSMVCGRANFGYKLHRYPRTNLIAEVEVSSRNILGFQRVNEILGRLAFSTETQDLLGFHVGYLQSFLVSRMPIP